MVMNCVRKLPSLTACQSTKSILPGSCSTALAVMWVPYSEITLCGTIRRLSPSSSYLDFPGWWTVTQNCKPNKFFPPQCCCWPKCFITHTHKKKNGPRTMAHLLKGTYIWWRSEEARIHRIWLYRDKNQTNRLESSIQNHIDWLIICHIHHAWY